MKTFFLRGLLALLPLALTAAVVWFVFGFLWSRAGVPIGEACKWAMAKFAGWSPAEPEHVWFFEWGAPFLGFAFAIVLTLVAGFLLATFVGKSLYGVLERLLRRIPFIGQIYPYARQFTEFFLSPDRGKTDFKHAVAVPFPHPGTFSIAFVTGEGMKSLNESLHKHLICVFVPTSPTFFTGYVLYVPREDVVPLALTVEEAMRIILTMGVVHPGHQLVRAADLAAPAAGRPLPPSAE
jgi:uncharacterized membrane protein